MSYFYNLDKMNTKSGSRGRPSRRGRGRRGDLGGRGGRGDRRTGPRESLVPLINRMLTDVDGSPINMWKKPRTILFQTALDILYDSENEPNSDLECPYFGSFLI